ncbi:MAG: hypothetical protein FJ240_08605 [Nitrospira sp.]|nr:hypothetical protein [Nitrospira sp.]
MKYTLPSITKSIFSETESLDEPHPPSSSDYIVVSENNLFHPERKIPPEKKEEVPLPKPEFILFGTLITSETSLAYIEDLKVPRNTAGRGKRQTTLKKGDMMSGFILKEVQADKIVMVRGEEKMVVPVHNPNRSKISEATIAGQSSHAPASAKPGKITTETLTKQEPPTKHRAPMTRKDEEARRFFQK